MTKKIFSLFTFMFLIVGLFAINGSQKVNAETYPEGCSSAIGYSITTGNPCNGTTNSAITSFLPGCTTALGYSTTNGVACSGGNDALLYLAGCSSLSGYSTATGAPCNGTSVVTGVVTPTPTTPTPGLPQTGKGGDAMRNNILLIVSGILFIIGLKYIVRKPQKAE